jgi:hypothetical protein
MDFLLNKIIANGFSLDDIKHIEKTENIEKIICNYFESTRENILTPKYIDFVVSTQNKKIIEYYLNNICMYVYEQEDDNEKIILNIAIQELCQTYQSIKYKYPKFYYNKYLFQKYTLTDMNMLDKIKDKIKVLQNIINYEYSNNKHDILYLMQG